MNKLLRFSFVALMMMLFSGLSATEITILPSDAEPTEGADYSVTKGGVTMYVTASTVTDSQFRIFKGQTITFVGLGEKITKVVFTCTAEGDAKYGPGSFGAVEGYTYEGKVGTWTGYAQTLIFTAESNQVRATQIVVTLGEGGDTPDNPDPTNDLLSKFQFNSGTFTDNGNQTTFDFTGVAVVKEQNIDVTGNFLFDFENEICTACTANLTFSSEIIAMLAEADAKANAEEDGFASVSRNGATLTVVSAKDFLGYSRILIKSMLKIVVDNEEGGYGILEAPLSPNQANVFAGSLDSGQTSEEDFFIKGKIAAIKYEFSAQYGTATFFISIDGQNDFTFQCYSVYYLENKPWVEGNTQIKVGDEVIICGKLVNYNGNTPETASKKAYIYSLNGKTKEEGGTNPNPQVTTATCAEVLAGADGTIYQVTGKCVEIANTTYGNWYLEDATGKVYIYGTLDAEGNTKNFASLGIEVGDEITVEGPRKTYKETVELVDVKVIAIKKGSSSEGGLIYSWEGGADGATEVGGKATYENGETDETKYRVNYKNGEYYTICINGKKGNIDDAAGSANSGYILITLDQALQAEDNIELTGYINKNESKEASIYFQFEKGDGVNDEYIFGDACNIDAAIGGKITPHVFKVPESAAGSKSFKMSRNKAGTNIFLTKLTINRGTTGIKEIKNVQLQNNAVYNLAGQKVGNDYKGIVIVNGKKFMQK